MDSLLKDLYEYIEETLPMDFQNDPKYREWHAKSLQASQRIKQRLGKDGRRLIDELAEAESEEDGFWKRRMFRRAVALGITLGRLTP